MMTRHSFIITDSQIIIELLLQVFRLCPKRGKVGVGGKEIKGKLR